MRQNDLFSAALGLQKPWRVIRSELKNKVGETKVLELDIGFESGAKFLCPCGCGEVLGVHDTVPRRWRHLNFWQHETVLWADVPRVRCSRGSARQIPVPWARAGSGFTLFFEAFAMSLVGEMSVSAAAELLGEHDGRIWRIIHHYVDNAHAKQDWSEVETLGIDETSTRKGHKYATVVVDIGKKDEPARLLFMTPDRTSDCVGEFVEKMAEHGAVPDQVRTVAIDMGRAYIKGAAEHLPMAEISFDRFHVMKLAGEAVDEVRKQLKRDGADLKGALWALRGNPDTLSEVHRNRRKELCREHNELGRALALREMLAETWGSYTMRLFAEDHLRRWCSWARRCRLEPFKKLSRTIQDHWEGILGFFPNRVTSAAIEAINGLIQIARRRARGYRNFKNLQAIAYWTAGRLDLGLPGLHPR